MGQLNFANNYYNYVQSNQSFAASDGTMSFFGFNIYDSISFNTLYLIVVASLTNQTQTFSIGLYSLNSSSLSIANSMSASFTTNGGGGVGYKWLNFTSASATQNITPGTWYFGIVARTAGNSNVSLLGQTLVAPENAFPGAFIGGRMTNSTNALPSSYATSNLDITGSDAMSVAYILLSS